MHQLFVDFKRAYDLVRMEVLFSIVIGFGNHVKVIRLTKTCLIETSSIFRVGRLLSDTFRIKNDLKQRDDLSPLLFNYPLGVAFSNVHDGLSD